MSDSGKTPKVKVNARTEEIQLTAKPPAEPVPKKKRGPKPKPKPEDKVPEAPQEDEAPLPAPVLDLTVEESEAPTADWRKQQIKIEPTADVYARAREELKAEIGATHARLNDVMMAMQREKYEHEAELESVYKQLEDATAAKPKADPLDEPLDYVLGVASGATMCYMISRLWRLF
jgi:hypothetical protein